MGSTGDDEYVLFMGFTAKSKRSLAGDQRESASAHKRQADIVQGA